MNGLGLNQLPPGVTESCDENDVVAYEVSKSTSVSETFRRVLDKGYVPRNALDDFNIGSWPGDYSIALRVRMWENGDIINIYDGQGGQRFGISAGGEGVFIRLNGMTPVQVSSSNVSTGGFQRIHLSFSGNSVRVKVGGRSTDDCGTTTTTTLGMGTADRVIPIDKSIVVLGREGDSAIEVKQPVCWV